MILKADDVCILIFNMQLELIPLLHDGTKLLNDCCWLADVASTLGLPALIIEHEKLGDSSCALKEVAQQFPYYEKVYFDCTVQEHIANSIKERGRQQFVIAGAESHVCILQSVAGLQALGKDVFVLSDTISARNLVDHECALERLARMGANLITKEMFFFECIRYSNYPNYQPIAMKYLDGRYIR
jgi:nicotinamidase-related amidase